MAKKKKISKKQQEALRVKKSAQQQVWRIQNKLDEPRISLDRKQDLESKLKEAKKRAGYSEPTKREIDRYSKEKRSISTKRSRLNKEFKNPKTTNKRRNEIRKELMKANKRKNEIEENLGKKKPSKKKVKTGEKIDIETGEATYIVPTWKVKPDYIDPALEEKIIKKFIIDGVKISSKKGDQVIESWYLYESTILNDTNTRIRITVSPSEKTMTITEESNGNNK
jgi:hypothetical protein